MSETRTHTSWEWVTDWDIGLDRRAVAAGAGAGVLVNLNALLFPPLNLFGGGIVAGFVAALLVGGLVRGLLHGVVAATVTGFAAGGLVAFTGWLVGLYSEPPSLLLNRLGPVSPTFDHMGAAGLALIVATITLFIAVDGLLGAALGGGLRAGIDRARDR
jgi:hypothetical protein